MAEIELKKTDMTAVYYNYFLKCTLKDVLTTEKRRCFVLNTLGESKLCDSHSEARRGESLSFSDHWSTQID